MKKSALKEFIREEIIEILSEETGTVSTKDPAQAELLAKKGVNVQLTKEEMDDDMEPTAADLTKKDSVATNARRLADVTGEMKSVVKKWKEAEGAEKEALLNRLKELTKIKKELEGLL